jgi:membrane-associated phospholipid phosphatase
MTMRAMPAANLALIRAFALPFGVLAGALTVGLVVFGWLGIAVDALSWRTMVLVLAIASGLVCAAAWLGNAVATSSALSVAWFLLMPAPLAIFSYAAAGLGAGMPLTDGALARIDRWLGFDWLAVVAWFNESPALIWLLGYAYHGTIALLIYVLVLLNVLQWRDRIVEFMVLVVGTCLLAALLSGVVPAAGAYVHFRPDAAVRSAISSDAGVWHLAQFEALRAGTFTRFSLPATEGLITFPSFHTAAALCVPLALRGLGAVTALAWAAAGMVVVSTVPIGGHHLIDVIVGAMMTLALHRLIATRKTGQAATGAVVAARPMLTGGSG